MIGFSNIGVLLVIQLRFFQIGLDVFDFFVAFGKKNEVGIDFASNGADFGRGGVETTSLVRPNDILTVAIAPATGTADDGVNEGKRAEND